MFRTEKPRQPMTGKPEIWTDGRQFAPFEFGAWARVSGILARRTAAVSLGRVSMSCANLALGLEEGRWTVDLARLGRAAVIVPSRVSVARGLARLSQVQARAAEIVDHHREEITPLDIQDLSAFMQNRRAAAQRAAAAPAQPPKRVVRQVVKPVDPALAAMFDDAATAPERPPVVIDAPDGSPVVPAVLAVSTEELMAIRMALASAPEPQAAPHFPGALTNAPAPKPVARSVFSTPRADWFDDGDAVAAPDPAPAPVSGPTAARQSLLGRLLRPLGAAITTAAKRGLEAIWRPIKGAVALVFATALGWVTVGLALPYGAVRATVLHFQHVDLRYSD